eukprot:Ihof_evm12s91 gene=Ihof_evmTU12s91
MCLAYTAVRPLSTMKQKSPRRPACTLLISGFFCSASWGPTCWGEALNFDREIIVSKCGPGSSAHDRACEIFYQMVGGTVDYGEEHSRRHGHNRYGATYAGEYRKWSGENAVDVIGHSFGGVTGRVLQNLLAKDYFGYNTTSNWVRSITTLNAPHHGSPLVYYFGHDPYTPGSALTFSPGWLVSKLTYMWEFLPIPSTLRHILFESNIAQWNNPTWAAETTWWGKLQAFTETLTMTQPFIDCTDNSSFDLTPIGAATLNESMPVSYPDSYYFSYVFTLTQQPTWSTNQWPVTFTDIASILLFPSALLLGRPFGIGIDTVGALEEVDQALLANDGICSAVSQAHPYTCDSYAVMKTGGCIHR